MSSKISQEVIDLCSDDDAITGSCSNGSASVVPSRRIAQNASKKRKSCHQGNGLGMRFPEPSTAAADISCERSRSVASLPLVFLDCDGHDEGVVTDGILGLVRLPSTFTCFGSGIGMTEEQNVLKHIQQTDNWSCGIRNLQMLLSALLPLLPQRKTHPSIPSHSYYEHNAHTPGYTKIPSIRQIQTALENSWIAGHDPKGAAHYKQKIVGKSVYIGTVEVSTCLSYMGIDNTLVQFVKCRESRSQLAPFCYAYFAMENCIYCSHNKNDSSREQQSSFLVAKRLMRKIEYGSTESSRSTRTCTCPYPPLYLQWNGHSVSVVGVETTKQNKVKNYLVFDPVRSGTKLQGAARNHDARPFRLAVSKLLSRDCQLIVATTKSLSTYERESLKSGVNEVTAAVSFVRSSL